MKVGILTLPLHSNYGGILQAYALKTVLENMGHDVWILNRDYLYRISFWQGPIAYWWAFLYISDINKKLTFRVERGIRNTSNITRRHIKPFVNKYLPQQIVASNLKNMKQNGLEAIIVGSDQVWRPRYIYKLMGSTMQNVFLQFAKKWNIKRLSYAPSFGVEEWEYTDEETRDCSELIKLFDAVSIREESGSLLCEKYLGRKATHVLDPTMLVEVSQYEKLITNYTNEKETRGLLSYILDETDDKKDVINKLSSFFNYEPFIVNNPKAKDNAAPLEERVAPPIELWLRGFRDAKFVITDSFHACVFSILFKKPFFVYGNESRGLARFHSLLAMFGLENRIIHSYAELTDDKLNETIDWETVHEKLEKEKEKSFHFLQSNLGSKQ